jgi:hypothetical protein
MLRQLNEYGKYKLKGKWSKSNSDEWADLLPEEL